MRSLSLLPVFAFMLSGQELTTIKLTPRITATLKRNPAGLRETFAVTASAGQTLLVELNIGQPDVERGDDRIQVSGPGDAAVEPEPDLVIAGYNWMNVLPQPGTYRVTLLRAVQKPYVLRLTLMDQHDPRLDLGLRASQISMPALAKEIKWSREKFFPVVPGDLATYAPDRLSAIANAGHTSVTVTTVEGLKKTWWLADDGARRLAKLEAALKSGVITCSPEEFPGKVTDESQLESKLVFFTSQKIIQAPGLRAVRWVGDYDGMDAGFNRLSYSADGITPDGRYFVTISALIGHPAVSDPPTVWRETG